MCKLLKRHLRDIRRYILPEWLEKVEKAFIEYWEHMHDKTLRNNRKIVNLYTKRMTEEFMRLKTHWEVREEKRHNKFITELSDK